MSRKMGSSCDNLKEYIVTSNGDWNNIFLVSAYDSKDAVEKVFKKCFAWRTEADREEGYKPVCRSSLKAESVKRLHKRDGAVVTLN